jgi:hypothetical protein
VAVCEGVHEGTVKACELIWGQKQKVSYKCRFI